MRGLLALCLILAGSCLDLSWKEGIACGDRDRCPGEMRCCDGVCRARCATVDAATPANTTDAGPPGTVSCPEQEGGCYGCMPGCACTCAGARAVCCLKFGVATCLGCP